MHTPLADLLDRFARARAKLESADGGAAGAYEEARAADLHELAFVDDLEVLNGAPGATAWRCAELLAAAAAAAPGPVPKAWDRPRGTIGLIDYALSVTIRVRDQTAEETYFKVKARGLSTSAEGWRVRRRRRRRRTARIVGYGDCWEGACRRVQTAWGWYAGSFSNSELRTHNPSNRCSLSRSIDRSIDRSNDRSIVLVATTDAGWWRRRASSLSSSLRGWRRSSTRTRTARAST